MNILFWGQGQDWLPYMLGDIDKIEKAKFVNEDFPLDFPNIILYRVVRHLVLSPRTPFFVKEKWFKKISNAVISNSTPNKNVIVFFDWNKLAASRDYIRFLRENYQGIHLVYVFTNIVKISGASKYNILKDLKNLFDEVYTFEEEDSRIYGFKFSPLFYAQYTPKKSLDFHNRVFYVGLAKDRLSGILSVYQRLRELNVEALFYISRVKRQFQLQEVGLVFNERIPYSKVLEYEMSSSCLLEIVQSDAKGYTLKVRSAICNNKLLITNNPCIKKAPFYNPDYILYFEKPEDINLSFFNNPKRVSYTENDRNYFSLNRFVDKMIIDLSI